MFCKNCGKENNNGVKFCSSCGIKFSKIEKERQVQSTPDFPEDQNKSSWNVGKIIRIIIVLSLIGWGIYSSQDDAVIEKNNNAMSSFDSGNNEQAINDFKEASQDAVLTENKINTLKNLAYAYSSDSKDGLAANSFKEALALTTSDSFDYYLISGEIALLENKPNLAQIYYNKAYDKNPDDFQINNALTLFYLDINDTAPKYSDYKKALQYALRAAQLSDLQLVKQNLGIAYYFNENYSQAILILSNLTIDKDSYTAYWLGLSYAGDNDPMNAKFYFRKAIANGVEVTQEVYDYINSN